MRLRFRGDGDHAECTVFGLTFVAGEWAEIAAPPRKLLRNPMFEVWGDHDGDGQPGGSLPKARRVKRGDRS